jgi:hypothetical protein
MTWLLLVASLPGAQGALRLRLWRSMKALGAAILRDGVYLAPISESVETAFEEQAAEVVRSGGSAFTFCVSEISRENGEHLTSLFDRTVQYRALIDSLDDFIQELAARSEGEARRVLRQLKRDFATIEATDFFPGDARTHAQSALGDAELALTQRFSPEEPVSIHASIPRCNVAAFQARRWATRSRLWVDRVCSAWLIRRFIDPNAEFVWLTHAADCPNTAIGFDFDGAQFTHVEEFVTFEVLLRSFSLDTDAALRRIAALVHQLDVGGGRVPEAAGFEIILTGARERCSDDDALLDDMSRVLDDMYLAFSQTSKSANPVR